MRRWGSAVLLLAGLVSAVVGQFYLSYRRAFWRDGVFFYVIALLLFGLLWVRVGQVSRSGPRTSGWDWLETRSWRLLIGGGGAVMTFSSGLIALRLPEEADFSFLLWIWMAGVLLFVLSLLPALKPGWRDSLANWLRANRGELVRLGALFLVALLVRLLCLEEIPRNLSGDEGTWGLNGLDMLDGRLDNPFATRWFDFPSMSFLVWGVSARLFGESVAALRTLSPFIGAGTVVATYLLVREAWGQRVAWLAALLLTFGHYHLHYSRLAINNIADPFFAALFFWLLLRAMRLERQTGFLLAGAVLGLSWYGYTGARMILIVLMFYLILRQLLERDILSKHWGHFVLLGCTAVVVAAPLLLYYLSHPNTFDSRFNQVSIFASGWLEREQVITGRSAASLLLQQFLKSIGGFHYTVDPTFWYRPGIPLLDFISGVLLVAGLVWAFAKWRERGSQVALLWFTLAVMLGWFLTENPPSSQRLVIAGPTMAIIPALGLDWLQKSMRSLVGGSSRLWATVAMAVVGIVAVVNLEFYFLDYTPSRVFGNPTAEVSDALCDWLQERDEVPPIYFDGAPYLFWDFGAIRYRVRHLEGYDIYPEEGLGALDVSRGVLFVIVSQKVEDLTIIRDSFPGGTEQAFYSEANGRLLFTLYEISERR